ncbi:MAG: nicotinate (nicotinamide) nucleotide adenylyltransferase [Balneolaceae bacterium]
MSNRIGIFGGSFDPVHNGHIAAIKSFLGSGLIHKVLVLLTPSPPHKDASGQTDYDHRLNMLNIVFEGMDNVEVSDVEKRLPEPSYTLQTITHLQKTHPKNTYFLCLGEDSIDSFIKWYKYEEILDRIPLIVAERPGYGRQGLERKIAERSVFVDHQPVDISSTDIRSGELNLPTEFAVPKAVIEYAREHNLYK